jgi:hypothetical protein
MIIPWTWSEIVHSVVSLVNRGIELMRVPRFLLILSTVTVIISQQNAGWFPRCLPGGCCLVLTCMCRLDHHTHGPVTYARTDRAVQRLGILEAASCRRDIAFKGEYLCAKSVRSRLTWGLP